MDVKALIDRLGGAPDVARAFPRLSSNTVLYWGRRNSIPPRYWPGLIQLATVVGVAGVDAASILAAHSGQIATISNGNPPAAGRRRAKESVSCAPAHTGGTV